MAKKLNELIAKWKSTAISLNESEQLINQAIECIENLEDENTRLKTIEQKLAPVQSAVDDYYLALDKREHAGVAQSKAFSKIERALDRHWTLGEMLSKKL